MLAESTYVDKARENGLLICGMLGHVSYNKLNIMLEMSMLKGLPLLEIRGDAVWAGLSTVSRISYRIKSPSLEQGTIGARAFRRVWTGEASITQWPKVHGYSINDFSRYILIYFVKEKSEVLSKFKEFRDKIEGDLNKNIQCVCTDNGGEYTSKEFCDYL